MPTQYSNVATIAQCFEFIFFGFWPLAVGHWLLII